MSGNIVEYGQTTVTPSNGPSEAFTTENIEGANAAVREALEGDTEEVSEEVNSDAAEEANAVAEVTAEKTAKAKKDGTDGEDTETPKTRLTRLVKQREAARAKMREADEYSSKQKQLYEQQKSQLDAERAQLKEQAQFLQMLKTNPAEAIRVMGIKPDEFLNNLVSDGTPEGELRRADSTRQREIQELRSWKEQLEKREVEQAANQKEEARKAHEQKVLSTFHSLASDADKFPAITQLWGDDKRYLESKGHEVADLAAEALGRPATLEQICEYLEEEATLKLKKLGSKVAASKAKSGQGTKTPPPKGLSGQANQRSSVATGPRPEMDWEQRQAAAKAALRQVIKDAGDESDDD